MKRTGPPFLAAWMLEHWTPGGCNHALAGDLQEEFCAGRSALWYWHQVLSAVAIRCTREVRVHYAALLYAALWSLLAPVWLLGVDGLEKGIRLNEHLSKMNWPWSTLSDLGAMLAANLLFLWAGVLLYLLPDLWLAGNLRLCELMRGIRASLPALFVLWLALIVLPKHFVDSGVAAQSEATQAPTSAEILRLEQRQMWAAYYGVASAPETGGPRGATRDIGPRDAIADIRMPAMLARLPFFLVILCTLWPAASRMKRYAN